jgi:hypothetical protein
MFQKSNGCNGMTIEQIDQHFAEFSGMKVIDVEMRKIQNELLIAALAEATFEYSGKYHGSGHHSDLFFYIVNCFTLIIQTLITIKIGTLFCTK